MGHVQNGMAYLCHCYDVTGQRLDCMEKWVNPIATCIDDIVVPIEQRPDVVA